MKEIQPEARAKHLKQFKHLWAAGVFEQIPFVPTVPALTVEECFATLESEFEMIGLKMSLLSGVSENDWANFLTNFRTDNAMVLIRRFRKMLKDGEGLAGEKLEKLRGSFGGALNLVAAQDPLFRVKIEDYTNPDKKAGPF